MRLGSLGLATLGLLLIPGLVKAQDLGPLKAPARVRLVAPALGPTTIVGTITSADGDSLTFRPSGDHATDRSMGRGDLTRAWISEGSRSRGGEGMLIGAGLGVLVGLVITAGAEPGSGDAFAGAVVGGAVGLLLGGVIGLNVHTDEWREVPLSAHVGFNVERGGAAPVVIVSLGF